MLITSSPLHLLPNFASLDFCQRVSSILGPLCLFPHQHGNLTTSFEAIAGLGIQTLRGFSLIVKKTILRYGVIIRFDVKYVKQFFILTKNYFDLSLELWMSF